MDREILFRGKRLDNGEWAKGFLFQYRGGQTGIAQIHVTTKMMAVENNDYFDVTDLYCPKVDPSTVGQYTGLTDKNGVKIFEGDIVRYNDQMGFDIHSTVRIGKYDQDGSGGEYRAAECVGVYFEVLDFTRPDWGEEGGVNPQECNNTVSPLDNDVIGTEVIGNIHDGKEGEEA